MLLKINPHNYSCLCKTGIEKNAVDQLIRCEEEYDTFGHCGNWSEPGVEEDRNQTDGDSNKERINSFSSNSNMELFNVMFNHGGNSSQYDKSDIQPWKVCPLCHYDDFDNTILHDSVTQEKASWYNLLYSQQHSSTAEKNSGKTSAQSDSSINWYNQLRTGDSPFQGKEPHHLHPSGKLLKRATSAQHSKKLAGRESGVELGNSKSTPTSPEKTNVPWRIPSKIRYKFNHNEETKSHMEAYRKGYTNKVLGLWRVALAERVSGPHPTCQCHVPNTRVRCGEVREGSAYRHPAIKLSKYDFKINYKLRTAPGINCQVGKRKKGGAHSQPLPVVEIRETEEASPPGSPTVNRSRPTIPSNARGIICPTAIETPCHVVSCVRGHSLPKPKGVSAEHQSARRCLSLAMACTTSP